MEQHPVPQPITTYEFRLVGDMTLRQFGKLAAGIIAALIVYGINPPGFIKWPLIILFTLLGLVMAFVPFEGRTIDTWIIAFFKRIYSPTQYIWRQDGKFEPKQNPPQPPPLPYPFPQPPSSPQPPFPQPYIPQATGWQPQSVSGPAFPPPSPQPQPQPGIILETADQRKIFIPPPEVQARTKRVEAKFTPGVYIPATPSLPNLVVGFVRDKEGRLVEGAILEIRDSQGNPVRAFKTNKLGQFQSATPLHPDEYEIETEKEGYQFDVIKIKLEGKILPPIEIVSK